MVPIEMSTPHSYSISILIIGPSRSLIPQYTTRQTGDGQQTDGQTDRNRPPMLETQRVANMRSPTALVDQMRNQPTLLIESVKIIIVLHYFSSETVQNSSK